MAILLTTICDKDDATCLSLFQRGSTKRNLSAIIRNEGSICSGIGKEQQAANWNKRNRCSLSISTYFGRPI